MNQSPSRLLLLDTASLYFRAYYGVPDSVKAPDGSPANAVRGLLDFMARLTTDLRPDELVACWDDDWRPEFRVALVPSYKAHRVVEESAEGSVEDVPDTLAPQVEAIAEVLDAYGIARVGAPGYEADDVIGTLASRHEGPVDIVTGDRDLFQLVDDSRPVRVLYTARGVKAHDVIDETEIERRYGIPGRAYAEFAALRGDPSDGLPGVPGVGEKMAARLINQYGTVDAIIRAVDGADAALPARKKLEAARDYLDIAHRVVDVVTTIDLPELSARPPLEPRDPIRYEAVVKQWGLSSSMERLRSAIEHQRIDE